RLRLKWVCPTSYVLAARQYIAIEEFLPQCAPRAPFVSTLDRTDVTCRQHLADQAIAAGEAVFQSIAEIQWRPLPRRIAVAFDPRPQYAVVLGGGYRAGLPRGRTRLADFRHQAAGAQDRRHLEHAGDLVTMLFAVEQ